MVRTVAASVVGALLGAVAAVLLEVGAVTECLDVRQGPAVLAACAAPTAAPWAVVLAALLGAVAAGVAADGVRRRSDAR